MKRNLIVWLLFAFYSLLFISSPSIYAAIYTRISTGGTASASSYYSGSTPARAFDWRQSTCWCSNGNAPQWLKYKLTTSRVVSAYKIYPTNSVRYPPKSWKFQGSSNGSSWVTLDTQSGWTSWTAGTPKTFKISNKTPYRYYRIYITATNPYYHYCGTYYYIAVSELALYVTNPPDLTITPSQTGTHGEESITLDWSASNVTLVSINQGVGTIYSNSSGASSASGSISLTPTSTTTYTVTATGPGGTKSKLFTVTVYPDVLDYDEDGIPDWYELYKNGDFNWDENDGNCDCN